MKIPGSRILLVSLLAQLILVMSAFSQEITGKVYGIWEGGVISLSGVNIYWENTKSGTVSGNDGSFAINRDAGKNKLVFSHVGYQTQLIDPVLPPLEIILQSDLQLGEVTIVKKDNGRHLSSYASVLTEKITGAELHKAACCNLAESFETNPSVDVSYTDAVTGARQIRLLGLDGIYSQLQTDNIPNFRGLATGFGLTYIPGPWMESIQVSKGTASVINGYESVTGQINVSFKKPDSDENLHLNGFISADGKLEFNANKNLRLPGDKLTTGMFVHVEDLSSRIDHNNDGFLDHPLTRQLHLYNIWKYNDQKGLMIHWAFRYLGDNRYGGDKDLLKNEPGSLNNPYKTGIKNNLGESVFKIGYVWPSQHTALALLSNLVVHDLASSYGLNNYDARENRAYANLVLTRDLDLEATHILNAGISYFYDAFDEVLNSRNMERYESVPGIFAEYTWKPSEKITAMMGVRGDHHNIFGSFVTPRAHLRYQPIPALTLRASAGKGYRTANVLAENSHLLSNYRQLDFEEVQQEEAWNWGISLVQNYLLRERDLQISAEFYRTDFIKQLVIDRESSSNSILLHPLNGKSWGNSLQVEVRYPVIKNLDVTMAWRQNEVKQTIGGQLLDKPYTSRYKGLITANYTTNLKKWMFDYTVQFNGGGRLPKGLYPGEDVYYGSSPSEFPAYTIMNAQITKYFRFWNIYAGVENLTGFMQENPVLGAEAPFSPGFDATNIWGPVMGRRIYAGIRFTLDY